MNREVRFGLAAFIEALLKPVFAHYHYYCAHDARKHALGMVKFGLFIAHVKRVLHEKQRLLASSKFRQMWRAEETFTFHSGVFEKVDVGSI